jgi:hypothetical protein
LHNVGADHALKLGDDPSLTLDLSKPSPAVLNELGQHNFMIAGAPERTRAGLHEIIGAV